MTQPQRAGLPRNTPARIYTDMKFNMYKAQISQSKIAAILALAVIFLSGYWLKCHIDIGFFRAISLSGYLPFK